MRRLNIIVILALVTGICWTGPARAQNFQVISSTLWSYNYAVAVSDHYAYCVFSDGIEILDISSPQSPAYLTRLTIDGPGGELKISGDYAYLSSGRNSPFRILSIADPINPVRIGTIEDLGAAFDFSIQGQYVYIALGSAGLKFYNISDPANPSFEGVLGGYFYGICVSGQYAYLNGAYGHNFTIANVENPQNPQIVGSFPLYTVYERGGKLVECGDYVYALTFLPEFMEDLGFIVIDVGDPSQPDTVGSYYGPSGSNDIAIKDNYIYLSSNETGLEIVDVTNPAQPTYFSGYDTPGYAADILLSADFAFIADGSSLQIVDISNPSEPLLAGSFDVSGETQDVACSGIYVYAAFDVGGLKIVDMADPANPVVCGFLETPGRALDIALWGDYAYIADNDSGLQIIEVADPANPLSAGRYQYRYGDILRVAVQGDFAYLLAGSGALLAVNITDMTNPILADDFSGAGTVDLKVASNFVYVTGLYSGLKIIDIANPYNLVLASTYQTPGRVYGIDVQGNYAYVSDLDSGLTVLDISNPYNPVIVGNCSIYYEPRYLEIAGNYAYVAKAVGGFYMIDISNPAGPFIADSCGSIGELVGVSSEPDLVYLTDISSLLILGRFPQSIESDRCLPSNFSLSPNYPNPFNPTTNIRYTLAESGHIKLTIYDILGCRVAVLFNGVQTAGNHNLTWNASAFPSGLYFARLETGEKSQTIKMMLLK